MWLFGKKKIDRKIHNFKTHRYYFKYKTTQEFIDDFLPVVNFFVVGKTYLVEVGYSSRGTYVYQGRDNQYLFFTKNTQHTQLSIFELTLSSPESGIGLLTFIADLTGGKLELVIENSNTTRFEIHEVGDIPKTKTKNESQTDGLDVL